MTIAVTLLVAAIAISWVWYRATRKSLTAAQLATLRRFDWADMAYQIATEQVRSGAKEIELKSGDRRRIVQRLWRGLEIASAYRVKAQAWPDGDEREELEDSRTAYVHLLVKCCGFLLLSMCERAISVISVLPSHQCDTAAAVLFWRAYTLLEGMAEILDPAASAAIGKQT